jgi:hypothetical protein
VPPDDLDKECLELCVALNKLPGIRTISSCAGHAEDTKREYTHEFWIFFLAESLDTLPPVLYFADHCHTGCVGWKVSAHTDCGMAPAYFLLEGPRGHRAYADAKIIAKHIEQYIIDEVE